MQMVFWLLLTPHYEGRKIAWQAQKNVLVDATCITGVDGILVHCSNCLTFWQVVFTLHWRAIGIENGTLSKNTKHRMSSTMLTSRPLSFTKMIPCYHITHKLFIFQECQTYKNKLQLTSFSSASTGLPTNTTILILWFFPCLCFNTNWKKRELNQRWT